MENQKNNKGVIALLIVIIVILATLCILFATGTINLKSNNVDSNETNQNIPDDDNTENNDTNNKQPEQNVTVYDDNVAEDILGTYYNSDDSKNYFTLKANGKADYASVDCNTGNVIFDKDVSYRVITQNESIILEIDINDNGEFNRNLIGSKYYGSNYRFRSTVPGCNDMENTYYAKK